jgi:hypothetical protein
MNKLYAFFAQGYLSVAQQRSSGSATYPVNSSVVNTYFLESWPTKARQRSTAGQTPARTRQKSMLTSIQKPQLKKRTASRPRLLKLKRS